MYQTHLRLVVSNKHVYVSAPFLWCKCKLTRHVINVVFITILLRVLVAHAADV